MYRLFGYPFNNVIFDLDGFEYFIILALAFILALKFLFDIPFSFP